MLSPDWGTARLFLHVLAATVWVGGQLVLGGLVGTARRASPDFPRVLAQAFGRLAWPAFILLLGTGAWNVVANQNRHGAWTATLTLKIVVALLSGVSAYLHQRARERRALALWGAVSGLSALGALFLGVLLAG